MSNIFDEIVSDAMPKDDELILELASAEDIPQFRTLKKQVMLPYGNPAGKGCLAYLYSSGIDDSIEMMNNKSFQSKNKYRAYYFEPRYNGKIGNRPFRVNELAERNNYYTKIKKELGYTCKLSLDNTIDRRNMYFDLFRYVSIFDKICENYQPLRYITAYWNFFGAILKENHGYDKKFILVDLSKYKPSKDIKENLKNPLYVIYYTIFKNPSLLNEIDIPFYFYNKNKVLVFNPSLYVNEESALYDKDLLMKIKRELTRMQTDLTDSEIDNGKLSEIVMDNNVKVSEIKSNVAGEIKRIYSSTPTKLVTADILKAAEKEVSSKEVSLDNKINAKIDNTIDKIMNKEIVNVDKSVTKVKNIDSKTLNKVVNNIVSNEIDKDKELLTELYYQNKNKTTATKSAASTARDEMLRKEQENIEVKGTSVKKLSKITGTDIQLDVHDVSSVTTSTNPNVKKISFANMNKEYNEKLLQKDLTSAILSLNDKSIPMFVRDIKVTDSSDELNYKDTYTILLEDSNRKRHTINVDIPKFIDDKFLYIGGNKKIIKYQSFYLPIVKIKPEVVEVVTNYSKMTVERDNVKSISSVERLKKLINTNDEIKELFITGNGYVNNRNCITTIEYDDLSKNFIKFVNDKLIIFFDQSEATMYAKKHNIEIPSDKLFIGVNNKEPLYVDIVDQESTNGDIVSIIVESLPDNLKSYFDNVKSPKRLVYAKVKIMKQFITVGMLLGFWIGLTKLLEVLGCEYRLADNTKDVDLKSEEYIKFKDCYLVYKQNMYTALVMNGFRQFDTFNYEIAEMEDKFPYLAYLKKIYGTQIIENALMNFYEFLIDPITKEVLEHLHLPTDIVHVLLHAVKLLSDSQYKEDIDQNLSRIRCNEIIPAILYEKLAKNYINFRNFNGRRKFTIPKDTVVKELIGLKTVEDYSTLNPTLEMYQLHAVSTKGFRGVNLDESYTPERRSYDPSMNGIISPSTPPDGSCGVSRNLSTEPNIVNLRGIVDDKHVDRLDELKDVNILSPAEMTMPYAATIDDPNRLGHAVKQSSHVIPVKNSCPILISNGFEEVVRFHVSSNFVINAEEDGEIIDYDEKSKIMIAKYKSGKCQAINLDHEIVKNGGGGFFLSNTLTTDLKIGDKFKKDAVLGYHKDFFTNDKFNNCRMNMGTLTKVAIMSTYNTYEDATMITKKMSEECASELCFKKSAVIGKNSNVFYIAKKGQEITVGDPLIQFDTSFDDNSLNALLKNLSDDNKDIVLEDARNEIKSKYSGVIEDIKIYSTVDLDDMSDSLRKVVSSYYKDINHKKEFLNKYDEDNKHSVVKCGLLMTETDKRIDPNKFGVIKGEKVSNDSVLVEFYIKHTEPLEVGSKIANFTALKNTIGEVIPEGYEPYSDFRPDEEIGTTIASNSILNRMVPSIFLTALGNKCIIELKRHLKELNYNRPKMEKMIYDFFTAFDKSGANTKKYKAIFQPMTDIQFKKYFTEFFENDKAYLVLEIVDFERTVKIQDVEDAAKVINTPLYEYVTLPHITMDKEHAVVTKEPVPVGYICEKRTQQTVKRTQQ